MKFILKVQSWIRRTKLWPRIKQNKFILLGYVVFASIFVIIANVVIDAEIEESYADIQNEINYGIFENKNSFGVRSDSYSVVSYSKSYVPSIDMFDDKSLYQQEYGGIETYYKASGGWTIIVFKKVGNIVVESSITPCGVGFFSSFASSSPESYFRQLYNSIVAEKDYNIDINNESKITKLKNLTSKFHGINVNRQEKSGLMWYNYSWGKAYSQIKEENSFFVSADISKIEYYRALYICIALFVAALLCWILMRFFQKKA